MGRAIIGNIRDTLLSRRSEFACIAHQSDARLPRVSANHIHGILREYFDPEISKQLAKWRQAKWRHQERTTAELRIPAGTIAVWKRLCEDSRK